MTFNGDHIEEPTLAMIEIYVAEKGYYVDINKIYDKYSKQNWLSNKGNAFETLEEIVDNANKIYEARELRKYNHKLIVEKRRARRKMILDKKKHRTQRQKQYGKLLEKREWKEFRLKVFKEKGKKCEMCGSEKYLQIHHPRYIGGRLPWEYGINEVVVLCGRCHRKIHRL